MLMSSWASLPTNLARVPGVFGSSRRSTSASVADGTSNPVLSAILIVLRQRARKEDTALQCHAEREFTTCPDDSQRPARQEVAAHVVARRLGARGGHWGIFIQRDQLRLLPGIEDR